MNDELTTNEVKKSDLEKIEKIKISVDKIKNKKSKFLFCVPESQAPVASVYEIYFHATVMSSLGYDVTILVEKGDYVIPTWIESELTSHKHLPMSDPKISVSPEDVMVIPEVYSNVMEQTKNLPCIRVGFLQSADYMLNSIIPGTDWSSFGVRDIITTSRGLKEFIEIYYGNKFNVKTYNIGIPDYFQKSNEPQKPIISIIGRNPNEISKVVKLFFSRYPQYSWVTFDPMLTKSKPPQAMRRVDFAKRLQGNFAAIWIDRIASFGTFPLECMKSGVIPICLKPDINPEYILERDENGKVVKFAEGIGHWSDNIYDIPIIAGNILTSFLEDSIPDKMYDGMSKTASKYTQEESEKQITEIYEGYLNQRMKMFEDLVAQYDTPSTESVDEDKNNLI